MFFATLNEYFDPISKGRSLQNKWKRKTKKVKEFTLEYNL